VPTWLALVGVVIVLGFVTIRAASFCHFDHFMGSRALGLKWNWVWKWAGYQLSSSQVNGSVRALAHDLRMGLRKRGWRQYI
jgi:hypothetical protein